jgi:membrane protein implicated in regulation of membrane protease activity
MAAPGAAGGAAAGAGGAAATGALGSLTPAIAAMLPLLGMQFGGAAFPNSRLASGIGMGAGLALGGAGAVALLGGSSAAIFSAGGALASLGPLAGLLTNPFTIGIAGAALVAAYFINRSAKRRKEEEERSKILLGSKTQMEQLIATAKSGRMTVEEGRAQYLVIRQNYLQQVGQLTDSKTRRIAEATVREIDYQWSSILMPMLQKGERARDLERAIVPTFQSGGQMDYDGLAYIHRREVVLNESQQRQVGIERLRGAVPNYRPPASAQQAGSTPGGRPVFKMAAVLVAGEDAADELISRGDPNTFYEKVYLKVGEDGGQMLERLLGAGE